PVQVGAWQAVRLALLQVAAQADVPVGQGEHRLGLGQQVELQRALTQRPGVDLVGGRVDHGRASRSARSFTARSAPWLRRASAWPTRSTPTTKPDRPGRPPPPPPPAPASTG